MKKIEVVDRKFNDQYINGADFSTNPTTKYSTFPQYNSGDKARSVLQIEVSTITEASPTVEIKAETDGSSIKFTHPINNWKTTEGFAVGQTVRVEANGANVSETVQRIQGRYMWTTNTSFFSTLGTTSGDWSKEYVLKVTSVPDQCQFKFGIIPNDEQPNFDSLITGEPQIYSMAGITGAYQTMDYLGSDPSFLGEAEVKYDGASGTGSYIFAFTVRHTFEWPSFIGDFRQSYIDGTIPIQYAGLNSYRYLTGFNFVDNRTNPNNGDFVVDDFMKGSIGFVNQNFNGGKVIYSLVSCVLDVSGTVVEDVDVNETTSFTVQIGMDDPTGFTAGVKAYVYHMKLSTETDYTENNLYTNNFIVDRHFETDGGGTTSSSIIKNLNVAVNGVDNTKLDVTFDLEYGTTQKTYISDGDYYFIGLSIADSSLANEESDRVTVAVNISEFIKSAEITGLITNNDMSFHNISQDPALDTPYTSAQSNVGGMYLVEGSFDLAKTANSDDALVQSFSGGVVAYNPTTGDWFWLYKVDLSLSDPLAPEVREYVDGTLYQGVCFRGRGSLGLPVDHAFNDLELDAATPASYSATQSWSFKFGIEFPWRSWERNPDANPVFFSCDRTTFGGLNYDASNYSGVNGYAVYIAAYADVLAQGVTTPYLMLSESCTIKEFGDDTFLSGWTQAIAFESADTGVPMENGLWLFPDEDIKVTVTLDNPGALVTLTDYTAGVMTEPTGSTSRAWRLHSSYDFRDENNPFEPLEGEDFLTLSQVSGTPNQIVFECLYKKEFLEVGVPVNIYTMFKKK